MNVRNPLAFSAVLTIFVVLLTGCTALQPLPMEAPSADADSAAVAMTWPSHAEGLVVSHPATGAMEPIDGATAHIIRADEGVLAQMHAIGLEPGSVYTAWWVIANNPEVCEANPCSGGDFIGKAIEAETVVTCHRR